jgi:hypothetical protein
MKGLPMAIRSPLPAASAASAFLPVKPPQSISAWVNFPRSSRSSASSGSWIQLVDWS